MNLGRIMLVEGPAAGEASVSGMFGGTEFHLDVVTSVKAALLQAAQALPGVVIYDSGTLEQAGGCLKLHNEYATLPIIHIYPAGSKPNPDNGATVHLTRPLSKRKLLNRVQRLLPAGEDAQKLLQAGDVTLDLGRRLVTVAAVGEYLMTPRQTELLAQFLQRPGELITRKQLMKVVWQTEYMADTRTLDVHIRWVRERIEENPSKPRRLLTKRGKGYIFMPQATAPTGAEH
jgi:DNA-binding response OmpR family regulator